MDLSGTSLSSTTVSNFFQQFINPQCQRKATDSCEAVNSSTVCFGNELPYSTTSFELVTDASTLKQVKEKLLLWSGKL